MRKRRLGPRLSRWCIILYQLIEAETKWTPFRRRHFQTHFYVRISINISLKFVPKGLINNIPALVQIMAWRRPGDKPLSELMMVNLLTHICVNRPQWVKYENNKQEAPQERTSSYCIDLVLYPIASYYSHLVTVRGRGSISMRVRCVSHTWKYRH